MERTLNIEKIEIINPDTGSEINQDGFIIKSCTENFVENKDLFIKESVPKGLFKPKWNGSEWIEGKDIEELKSEKISEMKIQSYKLLSETDWKVIRHRDQIDSNTTPSLSEAEYTSLLTNRKYIRDKSNSIEMSINALTTISEVNDYVIDFS